MKQVYIAIANLSITWCMPSWPSLHFSVMYRRSNELDFCTHESSTRVSKLNVLLHHCLLNT